MLTNVRQCGLSLCHVGCSRARPGCTSPPWAGLVVLWSWTLGWLGQSSGACLRGQAPWLTRGCQCWGRAPYCTVQWLQLLPSVLKTTLKGHALSHHRLPAGLLHCMVNRSPCSQVSQPHGAARDHGGTMQHDVCCALQLVGLCPTPETLPRHSQPLCGLFHVILQLPGHSQHSPVSLTGAHPALHLFAWAILDLAMMEAALRGPNTPAIQSLPLQLIRLTIDHPECGCCEGTVLANPEKTCAAPWPAGVSRPWSQSNSGLPFLVCS